jgi:hypothetical protein
MCVGVVVAREYERVLIGKQLDIQYKLQGADVSGILYDEIRPFGSFLLKLDDDREGDWNTALSNLAEARCILDKSSYSRLVKKEDPKIYEFEAMRILSDKFESGDLISKYVALRIWYGYWEIRGNKNKDDFEQFFGKAQTLVHPFSEYGSNLEERTELTPEHPVFRYAKKLSFREKSSERFSLSENIDCIFVQNSLMPIKKFYADKIGTMKKHVMKCERCGQFYIADSERFQYCGDVCKKMARKRSLEQRRGIGLTAEVDRLCNDAYAHWNNRLTKIRKSPEWSAEAVQIYADKKMVFQKKKTEMRKRYKAGEISFSELRDWLIKQSNEAENALYTIKVTQR